MDFEVQFCFFNRLKDAVMSKDPKKVEETLKEYVKNHIPIAQLVSMQNDGSDMLLHVAVQMGNPDILRQLLVYSDEESVNQCTTHDRLSPISLLLRRDHCLASAEEMLLSLLAAKADPNLLPSSLTCGCDVRGTHYDHLPLYYALRTEQWRMAEILLDAGADPQKGYDLSYPIDFCLEKPHLVQRLLDLGGYHPHLLSKVVKEKFGRVSEKATLHLCKMILPYHFGPEVPLYVIWDAADSGFLEVLLYLLSELKPGIKMDYDSLPFALLAVSEVITPQNYRRFLSAYFRFLNVNKFDGPAYLFLLLTVRKNVSELLSEVIGERQLCN